MDQSTQENGVCTHPACPFSGMTREEIISKIDKLKNPDIALFDVECCNSLSGVTGEALKFAAGRAIRKCRFITEKNNDLHSQEVA